jgi:hypothetical protein
MRRLVCLAALAALLPCVAACDNGSAQPPTERKALLDPQQCQGCHPVHFDEWSGSMHAYASEDPVFRAMNRRGQRETNGALGDFCVKCHAPLAVRDGLTHDGLNLDTVPAPYKGVTCYFCHTIDSVSGAHDNPLVLGNDGAMLGSIRDPVANGFHKSRYSANLDSARAEAARACGSCHDIVNDKGTAIERTFAEWQGTLFAQPATGLGCAACHMNGSDGPAALGSSRQRRVHSHAFPALDLALTPFPNAEVQRAGVLEQLGTALQPALCYDQRSNRVVVVIDNSGAGHSWPSGAGSDRRAWLEVVAYKDGQVIYQSGVVPEGSALEPATDPDLLLMRDCFYDETGREVHMFWEAARLTSNLLPGAAVLMPGVTPAGHVRWDLPQPSTGKELPAIPDRITMRVRVRSVASEVLAALVASGDLDAAVAARVPTLDLPHTNLEWRPGLVNFVENARDSDVRCVAPPNAGPGYTIATTPAISQAVCDPGRAAMPR